jgi:hypothetical protein
MADTELSSKLYEKMSAEQDKFRSWLLEQPPFSSTPWSTRCVRTS